jgi:hypothetical protein
MDFFGLMCDTIPPSTRRVSQPHKPGGFDILDPLTWFNCGTFYGADDEATSEGIRSQSLVYSDDDAFQMFRKSSIAFLESKSRSMSISSRRTSKASREDCEGDGDSEETDKENDDEADPEVDPEVLSEHDLRKRSIFVGQVINDMIANGGIYAEDHDDTTFAMDLSDAGIGDGQRKALSAWTKHQREDKIAHDAASKMDDRKR